MNWAGSEGYGRIRSECLFWLRREANGCFWIDQRVDLLAGLLVQVHGLDPPMQRPLQKKIIGLTPEHCLGAISRRLTWCSLYYHLHLTELLGQLLFSLVYSLVGLFSTCLIPLNEPWEHSGSHGSSVIIPSLSGRYQQVAATGRD